MLGDDFPFLSSDDSGEGRKTPEPSPQDSYTSSGEALNKKASAT